MTGFIFFFINEDIVVKFCYQRISKQLTIIITFYQRCTKRCFYLLRTKNWWRSAALHRKHGNCVISYSHLVVLLVYYLFSPKRILSLNVTKLIKLNRWNQIKSKIRYLGFLTKKISLLFRSTRTPSGSIFSLVVLSSIEKKSSLLNLSALWTTTLNQLVRCTFCLFLLYPGLLK